MGKYVGDEMDICIEPELSDGIHKIIIVTHDECIFQHMMAQEKFANRDQAGDPTQKS